MRKSRIVILLLHHYEWVWILSEGVCMHILQIRHLLLSPNQTAQRLNNARDWCGGFGDNIQQRESHCSWLGDIFFDYLWTHLLLENRSHRVTTNWHKIEAPCPSLLEIVCCTNVQLNGIFASLKILPHLPACTASTSRRKPIYANWQMTRQKSLNLAQVNIRKFNCHAAVCHISNDPSHDVK